jgi:hypothetical protein
MSIWTPFELVLRWTANLGWVLFQSVNRHFVGRSFQPSWAPAPLQKSWQRSAPPLGWPRTTDSLCPECVISTRNRILAGEQDYESLRDRQVGEIKAHILERDGKIVIEKTCRTHGTVSDVLSINPDFLARIEKLFPGRDFLAKTHLHDHGSSSIRFGRGSVLTIDLTNRCNMMCDPCFMDANQVGYVHELGLHEVQKLLDEAVTVQPKRQMSVQFSGGEPTISPHFLDAVAYAKKLGYCSVQAATNGIRFAQDPDFARQAKDAGLRLAYLQFDGVGNEANSHRKVKNLFDVKLRAIENLFEAGIDVVLVVTLVNTVNNDQVGPVIRFALDNCDKVSFVAFQPVSFTGRDEEISSEERAQKRYTLSHLAEDVKRQTGVTEPLRDWFPLSAAGAISDLTDLLKGPGESWGTMKCGCHPNCGVATALMVSKKTKEWAPLTEFIDAERVFDDARLITDTARGKTLTALQTALSVVRNYDPLKAPNGFRLIDLVKKFDKQSGGALGGHLGACENGDRKSDEWLILFIAGMWFQDLWTYDFRRTEMCIIPYATQMGEISFCAYNTGVGWRQIVEKIHQTAEVADWYRAKGRHAVYANSRKEVPLPMYPSAVALTVREKGDSALVRMDRSSKIEPRARSTSNRSPVLKGIIESS